MLLIFSESCWSTQKENKVLEKFFNDNKELIKKLLIRNKIEPLPTSQNANLLLSYATYYGNYDLVQKIIEAMGSLIAEYKLLYQAVRDNDRERGIEVLRKLLEEGVNPNGFALHRSSGYTPVTLFKEESLDGWFPPARHLKKDYKSIAKLLNQIGIEKASPIEVALGLDNYAAIELLLEYNAYDKWGLALRRLTIASRSFYPSCL